MKRLPVLAGWIASSVAGVALGSLSFLAAGGVAHAQSKEVTIAHQDMMVPYRTVMESGELEKLTGYKIKWRKFGGGGDVIRAMASGDVQVGEAGSSPIAAAVSQGQDLRLIWILDDISNAEALIAREGSGIASLKDLKGKRVATPFVSTAHYQLMVGMKLEGVDARGVNVMNMRPPEIAAAWERGDIDAAFIWDPILTKIKGNGKVIASSGTIGAQGYPTFDGLVVNAKWAAEHEAFLVTYVKLLAKADEEFRKTQASWVENSPQVKAVAKWTKADAKDVLPRWRFTTSRRRPSRCRPPGSVAAAKAMSETATFLKEQGRVQEVKPSYAPSSPTPT